ncbi:MAG: cell wall-binding repeat-containing protein [Chloroflexota bacterium]
MLAILLVLTILRSGAPVPVEASTVTPPAPAAADALASPLAASQFGRKLSADVYGYLPYWEIDSGTDTYLRYDLLTDIALFSVGFTATGAISITETGYPAVTGPTAATIVAHAHAAGVRVDLTITSFGYAKNTAFFTNPAAMTAAATAISNLVQSEGLDGVNLDVESLYNENFGAYGQFVKQLQTALRSWNPAARVSVATNGNVSGANMAIQALANGADRVFIMGYSYRTAGSSPAGGIAPIARPASQTSLTWTLDTYAAKGIPSSKVLLGLPYYGRSWMTSSGLLHASTTGSAGVFIPSDGIAAIPAGTVINHDPVEGAKWFATQDPTTGVWTQTYFDDPVTLRAKYDLANQRGLGGVGIWTLGYDRGIAGYWDAIAASFATVRIAGLNRYSTAGAIAADAFQPGIDVVYVATGTAFADALAAAAVAGAKHAPVLLVAPTVIPAATTAAIARLQPNRIVVVGGTGAVSDVVLAALGASAPDGVQRIAGPDRFLTAAALSAATYPDGAPVAYVVPGFGFADAVSAAPAAARDGGPVLLTRAEALPDATAQELVRLAPSRVVIVGGTAVVGDSVLASISALLPGAAVTRLAGDDRYATSAAVAATFATGVPVVYVASGLGFADALAAAAAAGSRGAPMVLTAPQALPASIRAEIVRLNPSHAIVVGGIPVVGEAVVRAIRDALAAS